MSKRIIYIILLPLALFFLLQATCEKKKATIKDQPEIADESEKSATEKEIISEKKGCIEGNCIDGYGTYVYDDGSVYTGNFKNGKRHGKGKMKWVSGAKNGEEYEGEWFNDNPDGYGVYTYADGSKYEGTFKDGKRHGKGTMTWASGLRKGEKYEGEWFNDRIEGKGVYTYSDGSKYDGEFKDGKKHGKGTMTWNSGPRKGEKYEGDWKDDKIEGKGIYTYADGGKYEGEFKDGKKHGKGTMTWNSGDRKGDKYTGDWADDNIHGVGKYYYADGRIYEGRFEKGKKHGYGVMTWTKGPKKGDKYAGDWKDDKMEGFGTYMTAKGKKQTGEWKDGKWTGQMKAIGQKKDQKETTEDNIASTDPEKIKESREDLRTKADIKKQPTDSAADNMPEIFKAEYIYIQRDWKNWEMLEGGLERYIKEKFLQIEFIDGNIAKAKLKKITKEREIGFNRWKTYWNIETDDGTKSKVPETSIWRIKMLKDLK